MSYLFYTLLFVLGAAIGSFLNVVIFRIDTRKSMFFSRSECPHCHHQLAIADLFPLFSFLFLRGRCRYCQQPISWQYFFVEVVSGIAFVLVGWHFSIAEMFLQSNIHWPTLASFLIWLFYISLLIIIFVYDLRHYLILDKILLITLLVAIIGCCLPMGHGLLNSLVAAAVGGGFFLLIYLLSRGKWMGAGDVKFAFVIGVILGWPNIIVGLFLAFVSGAIWGIGLMLFGQKKMKDKLPFGTFLAVATFAALFIGDSVVSWYLGLLQY